MFITADLLRSLGAGPAQVREFADAFPDGVDPALALDAPFNWGSIAELLLSGDALEGYSAVYDEIFDRFYDETAPARDALEDIVRKDRIEREKALKPAHDEYDRKTAPAKERCNAALAQAFARALSEPGK